MKKSLFLIVYLLIISFNVISEEHLTEILKKHIVEISLNPFLKTEEMQRLATIISNKGNTTDLSLRELYLNTYQQNAELEKIVKLQNSDGLFTDISYNDPALSSWDPLNHISRLLYVCRAYVLPESNYYHRKNISEFLHSGLNAWYRIKPVCRNWWYNQIGVPKTLGVVVILLENELSESEKNNAVTVLNNSGFRMTGQNKVWLAGNVLLKALLINDATLAKAARDTIVSEIYQTTNEGIQPDFSFHQHGPQQQFGNYGLAYINSLSYYANVFGGSSLQFSNSQLSLLRNYALDGENWIVWRGNMDVSACNRQLFKQAQVGKVLSLCVAINQLCQADSIHKTAYEDVILRNLKPGLQAEMTGTKHFWRSDLSVFRSSDSYISIRSCSPRVKGTEFTNNENKKGHFISDGCTIFLRRGDEYNDIFPVWDWNRIPGVTAPLIDSIKYNPTDNYKNPNPFVGGLTNGNSGISTFYLNRNGVTAKKSWFYMNGILVCLGTDIHSKSGKELVTTVNQCLQHGSSTVQTADFKSFECNDTTISSTNFKSVWHDSIGYYFPKNSPLSLSVSTQTGDWHQIADPYSTDNVSKAIFKLWINHGVNAKTCNSYQYMVLPSVSKAGLNDFIFSSTIEIISNNSSVQAVKSTDNSEFQFVFYKPIRVQTFGRNDFIVSKTPGLIQLEKCGENVIVTVVDPTQLQTEFSFTLSGKYSGEFARYNLFTNETTFRIPLPQGAEAGKCVTIELKR
ncbi:MAG: polysaccharide lyase family 8 super-sandwich domain-containing protein [Paludibacter sp.]